MNAERLEFHPPHPGWQTPFAATPSRAVEIAQVLGWLGAATVLVGFFAAPERIWPALLFASQLLLGLGLAGVFFVALQYATGSTWSVALRRVPEAMAAALPAGAIGLALVLLGKPSLYPWYGKLWEGAEGGLGFKQLWLSQPFFLARSALYLLVWLAFARAIVGNSRRQDSHGDVALTHKNVRLSVGFIVVFAFTFWLASTDWIMSLEPEWYSTIFGVYNFASLFLGGLAAIALLVVWLRRWQPLRSVVTREHLLDLGRLLFAFSTFWGYIWFSQYMLIWYANFPEEAVYFVRRLQPGWAPLFLLNLLLNWAVPFLVLLPQAAKQSPRVLGAASVVVLAGRALDLYLMILPPFAPRPVFGVWEAGVLLGAAGLFILVFLRALRQAPLVPVGDPFLLESLHYHA